MSERPSRNNEGGFMVKVATVIVDKRNLIFLLTVIALIFSVISRGWVVVENELEEYLPDHSEARQGLDVMEEQFVTYGTASVMVTNITFPRAEQLYDAISEVDGVQSVTFDEEENYKEATALYAVTFDYPDDEDEKCLEALDKVEKLVSGQDYYVFTDLGDQDAETLDEEISAIMVLVVVVVITVLVFTSKTWAEIPVLLLTFVIAMLLNMGTNFLLGTISFISNSVTSILQLALSLDYAIILCNRFKEEHRVLPLREAAIAALSKGIPEIGASSLTTIGGLAAMLFMQFKIGPDMAICLIKSIFFALLSVFVVMPGLLMIFGPLMDKTEHKSFVPKIPFVGKFAYATRYVIPPIFLAVIILAFSFSRNCPFAYGYGLLEMSKMSETQIAEDMKEEIFGTDNYVALVVPSGDYDAERKLVEKLETFEQVDETMGLSNVEAMDGYMLADELTPRQFSEMTDLDYEVAQLVYAAYAADIEDYDQIIGGISTYSVPLVDMLLYVCDKIDSGMISLDDEELEEDLDEAKTLMEIGKNQLQGEDYNRILVYLNLPVSGDETYQFLDTLRDTARIYYPEGNIYVVGESTSEYDFKKTFEEDNPVVTAVSILIVLLVLLFTFKSVGMPILLILVIQGSIWMNFSINTIKGDYIFFMCYLVVNSIQMGANIDYAIVIASRFNEVKNEMSQRKAIIETMNFAFPTIITSGSIMAVAGISVGQMTSNAAIAGIGAVGRGTIISLILVMFVLPQILLLGNKIVDKTSFSMPVKEQTTSVESGRVFIDGVVRGEIHGAISGSVRAVVEGDVDLRVISGAVAEEGEEDETDDNK